MAHAFQMPGYKVKNYEELLPRSTENLPKWPRPTLPGPPLQAEQSDYINFNMSAPRHESTLQLTAGHAPYNPEHTPEVTTEHTPGVTSEHTPGVTTEHTPEVTSEHNPEITPDHTSEISPEQTSYTLEHTPDITPEHSSEITLELTPEQRDVLVDMTSGRYPYDNLTFGSFGYT